MTASVGIVILDLNQRELTARCLRSLAKGSWPPDLVVLVENGSESFNHQHHVAFSALRIVTLHPGQNLGCAGGRNLGLNYLMKNSDVALLVVLDNDTVVPLDFIERVAALSIQPLEVVAPLLLDFRANAVWSCGGITHCDGSVEQLTSSANREEGYAVVDWAPGACLVMTRQIWETVGQFDQWMNFLFEDIEWCLRVKRAGGRVLISNGLHLFHEPHQSLGGRWSQDRVRLWARNGTVFRLTNIKPGVLVSTKWLASEAFLALRDLLTGRASWCIARFRGLAEGLTESLRRRIGRRP